jgi:hypothetical protein
VVVMAAREGVRYGSGWHARYDDGGGDDDDVRTSRLETYTYVLAAVMHQAVWPGRLVAHRIRPRSAVARSRAAGGELTTVASVGAFVIAAAALLARLATATAREDDTIRMRSRWACHRLPTWSDGDGWAAARASP